MTVEHDLPIIRACQVARLSRAAYYKPGVDRMARDVEVITALQAIVVEEQRSGFWKCHDRLRAQGYGWNHKARLAGVLPASAEPPASNKASGAASRAAAAAR